MSRKRNSQKGWSIVFILLAALSALIIKLRLDFAPEQNRMAISQNLLGSNVQRHERNGTRDSKTSVQGTRIVHEQGSAVIANEFDNSEEPTERFLGSQQKYTLAQYEEKLRSDRQALSDAAAKDKAMGLNLEIFKREAAMQKAVEMLERGMNTTQVKALLGEPYSIRLEKDWSAMLSSSSRPQEVTPEFGPKVYKSITFWYSPSDGLQLDKQNGKSYQELLLRFDSDGSLQSWAWEYKLFYISAVDSGWHNRRGANGHPYKEPWQN
jgi:hypothetical protein